MRSPAVVIESAVPPGSGLSKDGVTTGAGLDVTDMVDGDRGRGLRIDTISSRRH